VRKSQPAIVTIFGVTGDLTKRKLLPALFNLALDRHLPEQFLAIGVARRGDLETFRVDMREGIDQFSRRVPASQDSWNAFANKLDYLVGGFSDPTLYERLLVRIRQAEAEWGTKASRVFYMATPPEVFGTISDGLGAVGLGGDHDCDRIVVEKPFGTDLQSAKELQAQLLRTFQENQIYRIDHYLGKETVQNILALRFANTLFEPIWNRRYVDHVQITVAEAVGLEGRGGYYEGSGALRDMIQNHLLQILCLIGMEPPVSFDADEVRNKKAEVLRAVRRIALGEVRQYAVRGQYGATRETTGYRQEAGVQADSSVETYAALKLFIDNWRWQGVPFYLRTGKKLARRMSQVVISFRPVPHQAFPPDASEAFEENRLVIDIQPDERITMRFLAKEPGARMRLRAVNMEFCYDQAFSAPSREAYETLLQEVVEGNPTLFMRIDQQEAAWEIVAPILESWLGTPSTSFPNYAPESWGPEGADLLLAREGHRWFNNAVA
jgi:glucose-6-phosphate 1-dehydrogenase